MDICKQSKEGFICHIPITAAQLLLATNLHVLKKKKKDNGEKNAVATVGHIMNRSGSGKLYYY